MSKIHILEHQGGGVYRVVIHFATPGGNSTEGFAWSQLLVNTGRNKTMLPAGTGPGQIDPVEKAAVEAGTTVEMEVFLPVESGGVTGAPLLASLNTMADQQIAAYTAALADMLKHYGRTVG